MTIETCQTGAFKPRSYSGDYMKAGLAGQSIVLDLLKRRPEILGVIDWSDLEAVQPADIDCAIRTKSGHVILAEIKSDSYLGKTGNVLFEVLRINHTCDPEFSMGLGWTARTPAKYIFYYAPSVNKVYKFNTIGLRQSMQRYTREKRKSTRLDIVETDSIKTTINILIPIEYCKGAYEIYDIQQSN
jgi:hypothetical protein